MNGAGASTRRTRLWSNSPTRHASSELAGPGKLKTCRETLSVIPFDMVEPASLKEAVALLDPEEPTIRAVAGGTALMLMMKAGVFQPTRLVCLHRIESDYARIAVNGAGELRIGAMATLTDLEYDANVRKNFPVLARALPRLSNPVVRNV